MLCPLLTSIPKICPIFPLSSKKPCHHHLRYIIIPILIPSSQLQAIRVVAVRRAVSVEEGFSHAKVDWEDLYGGLEKASKLNRPEPEATEDPIMEPLFEAAFEPVVEREVSPSTTF